MQGDSDWQLDRVGYATSSRFGDILKGKSGKYLKSREDYLIELVAERLTGLPNMKSHGAYGGYGMSTEDYARIRYEAETGFIVKEVGFIKHPVIEWVGSSPDGFIGKDGSLEVKCPAQPIVHLKTILDKQMPDEHRPQVQGNMWVTRRKWLDFASFDPSMPDDLQIFIQRIERDDEYIETLAEEVQKFLGEVDEFHKKIPRAA